MAREFAEKFYKSKRWQKNRDAFFKSKHGLCERCQEAGRIVHHRVELTPENIADLSIAMGWDNLEVVCMRCHANVGSGDVIADGLAFDEDGNVVHVPPGGL
jgi:5-methylcytosine-specific restriction enzyme A